MSVLTHKEAYVDVSIGARIKAARTAAGMTQMDVARRTDLSLQAVGDIERGIVRDPHISSLRQIARALGIPVTQMLEDSFREPVPLAEAPAEAGPDFGEEQRPEDVPWWVTEWLRPDFQRAGEALDEYCREWTERQQRGELDHDAIERFFEDAEHWTPVVEPALIAEARQLSLTGQVPLDPNIDPNNLLSPEFLGLLDRLFSTGKLGSAWSRWMDLQDEFLAQAEEQAEDLKIDPRMLERIKNVAEESRARSPLLNALGRGRTGAA
jgi:transcriptional regulator with XRE-family HTH domain